MYPADDLMLLTDPPNLSKWSRLRPWALSSIINHCFNMPAWFFCFSHLQTVDSTTHKFTPKWLTGYDKLWPSANKTLLLAAKPLNGGRWCHSKWQWLCGIQLSTIRLSAKTAPTGSKLSNIGTSPLAFHWHLLGMMHMSCILLMISCYSSTLQIVKVVSSPSLGFVFNHQPQLQHACLIFLLLASADGGFDIW